MVGDYVLCAGQASHCRHRRLPLDGWWSLAVAGGSYSAWRDKSRRVLNIRKMQLCNSVPILPI